MKKLMIALAAVAMAVGVQASTVSWKISYAGEDLAGSTAYLFNNTDLEKVTAILGDFTTKDALLAYSLGDAAEYKNFTRNTSNLGAALATGVSATDNLFAIIFKGDIAVGTAYYLSDALSADGFTYDPPSSKPNDLTFTAGNFATAGTITQAVPEPTSGLLLLIGIAGMALRRRRA